MSFDKVLVRLTHAVENASGKRALVEVEACDLRDLLREHARLDADARATYSPHRLRLLHAVSAARATHDELIDALMNMPSRDELLKDRNKRASGL